MLRCKNPREHRDYASKLFDVHQNLSFYQNTFHSVNRGFHDLDMADSATAHNLKNDPTNPEESGDRQAILARTTQADVPGECRHSVAQIGATARRALDEATHAH